MRTMYIRQSPLCAATAHIRERSRQAEKEKMKHRQIIKSEHSNQNRNWMIFSTILFGFLTIISSKEIFTLQYVNLISLIISLFMLGLTVFSFNYLVNRNEIEISKNRIVSKNKFGKKIYPKNKIQGFKEEEYAGKYQRGNRLIFKTEKSFIIIDSNDYSNYYEIAGFVKKNFKKLNDEQFKSYEFYNTLFVRIFFLFASILFLGIFFNQYFDNIDDLDKDIQQTQITLSANPKIESSGGKRSKDYIRIFIEEYPEFKFKINGFRYKACNKSLINELAKGDKVKIGVKSNDLKAKMKKETTPSFGTKHFHWEQISIYQISHKNKEYLNLERVKRLMKNDRNWAWLFLLFGLFSIYMLVGRY